MKDLKEEIVDKIEKLNIVYEINIFKEEKYKNVSIRDLKKNYPDKTFEFEEVLLNYMGENDLKTLKTGFPSKRKIFSKKVAYAYEYFISIDDYQKYVENLKKNHFFSKLKNDYPDDEEIQRTMDVIKKFNFKSGEDMTQIFLKGDVLLLARVFEIFMKTFSC